MAALPRDAKRAAFILPRRARGVNGPLVDVRWTTLGVACAAVALAACHRQPRPTYEYEPTETYVSTAGDPAPQRAEQAAPGAGAIEAAPVEAVPTEGGPTTDPTPGRAHAAPSEEPAAEAAEPADASEIEPGRWYKAKPW